MSLLWINGRLVDKSQASISPFDHGFLYGDGVWEPLRVFGGKLFRPDDHMRLLSHAAKDLGIDLPMPVDAIVAAIHETLNASQRTDGYIRVIVTRGPGTLGPDPRKIEPQVIIIAEEYLPFPVELYDHGLHVVTAKHSVDPSRPIFRRRTLGRTDWVQAKRHALSRGCLEAVMTDGYGWLMGCTEGGIGFVSDGLLRGVDCSPLDVVATNGLGKLARELGQEEFWMEPSQVHQLVAADEVFLAGTSCGVIGIVKIDEQTIGEGKEGPITRQLRERYRAVTRGGG